MNREKIGLIGLGKMGSRIAKRLINYGVPVFVYDSNIEKVHEIVNIGGYGCASLTELTDRLERQKIILLCVPTGDIIDDIIESLILQVNEGDILVDLGNSYYKDSQRRAVELGKRGIFFVDVGVSGGIKGAEEGACLMIGGDERVVSELDNLFNILSNKGSYKYLGKSGSGHLVKGFHNLIEYGYLQSLAEGLDSVQKISLEENLGEKSYETLCDIWSKGSIIESRILSDAKRIFQLNPSLIGIDGSVYGQTLDEMIELIANAEKVGVKIYSCNAAVRARLDSQKNPNITGKIINAIRNSFGGHFDWKT